MELRPKTKFMPSIPTPLHGGILQRKCGSCGQHTVAGGGCSDCEKKKGFLHRRASSTEATSEVPPIVPEVLRSPGRPLDVATRAFMEPRFSHDFSHVRVHTDSQAATSARMLNAHAYTVGNNVVFGAGQYAPNTRAGRRLMAHELAHTVQQSSASFIPSTQLEVLDADGPGEREADQAASHIENGLQVRALTTPHLQVQRKPQEDDDPIHSPLIEQYRRERGLPPGGVDQSGNRVGPTDAEIKYRQGRESGPGEWTRKHTAGPRLLDKRDPSYQVWFDHVLPTVPTGVTQVWQVVEVTKTFLTGACETKTEKTFVVDIVKIDGKKKIGDDWGFIRRDEPCFAMEVSAATVGFDDQKSSLAQQTSVEVSETDAKDLIAKMAAPVGTYSGTYTFAKAAYCNDCPEDLKKMREDHKAPNGEALTIEGVGSWKS